MVFRVAAHRVQRLILFIDAQNFYNEARRAFFSHTDSHVRGQINPIQFANLICSRRRSNITTVLHQVRIYTGRPDLRKEPKSYAAHMKQCNAWIDAGAEVIARSLRYPSDWPNSRAQQKGVDVALAIDFVTLAVEEEYDIGIIASSDSDLKPAIEFIYRRYAKLRHVEVAAWRSPQARARLSIAGARIWCHWLDRADYDTIADFTDYNL